MPPKDLRGVICATITPLTPALDIDIPRLARHIERLLDDGCSFVSTFGTTGEGASLSTAAKLDALHSLRAQGGDLGRHIPAVMSPVLDEATAMLSGIGDLGCRAALILPPFYYSAGEAGLVDWLAALVERTSETDIDLVLYNIPQLSRVRFTPALIRAALDRVGARIVGVKDSTGDLAGGLELVRSFPDLAIFTGDDRVLPALVANGGAGMIGGIPNLFARDLVALYQSPQDAELLARQAKRIAAIDTAGSLVALKAALAVTQADDHYGRAYPPLAALDHDARANLAAILDL